MKCIICGKEFNPFTNGKPKMYCSENCRNFNKFYNALQKTLDKMEATDKNKKLLKGELFRMANTCLLYTSPSPRD